MKVGTKVNNFGRIELEITGETEHENSLLQLIAQKSFNGAYVSESAGTDSPTRFSMVLAYETPASLGSKVEPETAAAKTQ